uniref:Major sperm protein n=1 Tax=Acrobeloides nanus TaxID=290746 RepID=A0A914E6Y2_9BILA
MLLTEPHSMVTFNGPFEEGSKIKMKLNHVGGEGSTPISWSASATNPNRLSIEPACGLLEYNEPKYVVITCHSFDFANEDIANDYLKFEWRNTTEKDTDYSCNTLSDGLFRRKLLHVLYNP